VTVVAIAWTIIATWAVFCALAAGYIETLQRGGIEQPDSTLAAAIPIKCPFRCVSIPALGWASSSPSGPIPD
jgi:hypothetical protein